MPTDLDLEVIRKRLASSAVAQQEAIALFPLRVIQVASDLNNLCKMRRARTRLTPEALSTMKYMEEKIRQCFLETFGHNIIHD